jgi:hypothetical protein
VLTLLAQDIFIPGASSEHHFPRRMAPVMMFWHGGAWRRGDKQWVGALHTNFAIAAARAGMVGVVCNYRLQPSDARGWEDQVDDVAAAVKWAHDNVAQFGGDRSQLTLSGHSAGAHLVASLLSDTRHLERHGIAPCEVRSIVKGAILYAGVFDIRRLGRIPIGGAPLARSNFGPRGQRWAEASPAWMVHDGIASLPWEEAVLRCPLLDMPSLLLSAADDFHLDGDAVSMIRAMRRSRCAKLRPATRLGVWDEDDGDCTDVEDEEALFGQIPSNWLWNTLVTGRDHEWTSLAQQLLRRQLMSSVPPLPSGSAAPVQEAPAVPAASLAQRVAKRLEEENALLSRRIGRMEAEPVAARYPDSVSSPEPLLRWRWFRSQAGEPSPQQKETSSDWSDGQKGLALHRARGTKVAWGRVLHRNHITLGALVGQPGDPTTQAMVDFVRFGADALSNDVAWRDPSMEK